jgi:hypothetical protein
MSPFLRKGLIESQGKIPDVFTNYAFRGCIDSVELLDYKMIQMDIADVMHFNIFHWLAHLCNAWQETLSSTFLKLGYALAL